jgi:LuxR family maltose regulon positive regulatory protein
MSGDTAVRAPALFAVTKFRPPRPRAEHVRRRRCLAVADGPLAGRHLLISAAAGAGKSTLAAQWAAAIGKTAWVSLGTEDSAGGQVWAAVICALQTVAPEIGGAALPALLGGADTGSVLAHLVDDLAELEEPVAIVLDDFHLITDPAAGSELEWLLANAPDPVRICVCSRAEPQVHVRRLIARGLLCELRNVDLSFDQDETVEFMHDRLALNIEPDTAAELGRRVDGWAAGLYLTALSLRGGASVEELFGGLEAGDRRIRDYISSQMIGQLPPERRELLESLALLPRFCAELCDHVLARTDSGDLIEELDNSNLFVIPLDREGRWFRLHHLFARVLAARAGRRDPDGVAELHRRAASWHNAKGNTGEAIEHFVAARDFEAAAELIAAAIPVQINVSRLLGTLSAWLDLLPASLVGDRPALCIGRAWVAAINGRKQDAQEWVDRALALPDGGPLPSGAASAAAEAALLQATFCFKDYQAGAGHSADALALEARDSPWQPLVQLMYGWYAYHEGRLDEALTAYRLSERLATQETHVASLVIAPAAIAIAELERGNLEAADAAARRCDAARRAAGVEAVPQMLNSWFGTARTHRVRGRLPEALHDAEAAAVVAADYPAVTDSLLIAVPVTIELGRIRLALGDIEGAQAALADASARLVGATETGRIAGWLAEAQRELAAAGGAGAPKPLESGELTERELSVLRMLKGSGTLREISDALFISPNTMKTHCRTIYRKLGASGREDAVRRAAARGLI